MRLLVLFILIGFSGILKAHDPAIASFYLYEDDQQLNIRADFAWSIRNVLIKKYPFLKAKGVINDEFVDCMLEYMEDNVSIEIDDHLLAFNSIYQVPGAHTHSYVFILALDGPFEGKNLKIKNSCMFDFYKRQKNSIYFNNIEQCTLEKGKDNCTIIIDNQ